MTQRERNLESILDDYISKFPEAEFKCFSISNTSKSISEFYFTPIRNFDNISVGGVVVANTQEAIEISKYIDGKIQIVAVDSEKKIPPSSYCFEGDEGNIKGEVQDIIQKSELITYKANDITVDALDIFISSKIQNISSSKIALVGTGNIGFKIALKLVERGYWVSLFRRNQSSLKIQTEAINISKPKGTIASAHSSHSLEECLTDANVIVALADQSEIISSSHLEHSKEDALLIDCGKNCFAHEVTNLKTVYRTDVSFSLLFALKSILLSQKQLFPRFGKERVDNNNYVCGVSGCENDIVVSDIRNLDSIIGICDGKGGLTPYIK